MKQDEVVYDFHDESVISNLNQLNERRRATSKRVVLSFDDGPSRVLPQILDILDKEQVKAVFFWQTRLLHAKRPWKQVLDHGHQIGTHSCTHANLQKCSREQQYKQLSLSKQKIEDITGQSVALFRPPFGSYNQTTLEICQLLGLKLIGWEIASLDWNYRVYPEHLLEQVTQSCKDGSIILLHELKQTVSFLPALIERLKQNGFSFCTLQDG